MLHGESVFKRCAKERMKEDMSRKKLCFLFQFSFFSFSLSLLQLGKLLKVTLMQI